MNGISQCMYAVILIHLAGMTAYWSWRRLYSFLRKNASNLIYITLRQVCMFCLVPVGYLWVKLWRRNGYIQADDWWRMDFRVTGTVGCFLAVLWLVWVLHTVYAVVKELKNRLPQKEDKKTDRFPEKEGVAFKEFQDAKKEMKIHGFVSLYRDKGIRSPKTTGAIFARVLLPYLCDCEYSEEQLRVTYYHELTHYRSGDVCYKVFSLLAGLVWFFRFITIERDALLTEWSERNCDIGAIKALKGKMTGGEYFRTIIGMVEQQSVLFGEKKQTASMLIDNRLRLGRRIDYVDHYKETTKMPRVLMALFLTSFLTVNVASSFVTGSLLAELNDLLYQVTEKVRVRETKQYNLSEKFLNGMEDDTYTGMEYSENKSVQQSLDNGDAVKEIWIVKPENRYISNRIYLNQGVPIIITCAVASSTDQVWMGLMNDSSGDILYVEGAQSMDYVFEVPQDGDYYVFIQNCGKREIEVNIRYHYQ